MTCYINNNYSGVVYIVQPTQLVGLDKQRYKVGCSNEPSLTRCSKGYLKGTRYLCIMECLNPLKVEREIKKKFNSGYKLIAGAEFFELKEDQTETDIIKSFFDIVISSRMEDEARDMEIIPPPKASPECLNVERGKFETFLERSKLVNYKRISPLDRVY